jgi:anti-anti-sigma factor
VVEVSPHIRFDRRGEKLRVYLHGRAIIDHWEAGKLESHLNAVLQEDEPAAVDFILVGIEVLSSRALSVMVRTRQAGIHVRLINPSPHLRDSLKVTMLDAMIEILDAPEEG